MKRTCLLLTCLAVSGLAGPFVGMANDSLQIVDGTAGFGGVGQAFVNRFSVPSRDEALAKLQRLQSSGLTVTVLDFLGGKIRFIRVVFYNMSLKTFQGAKSLLDSVLNAVIISPGHPGPGLQIDWAEGTTSLVVAEVIFDNGTMGRIETDGWHVFFEDNQGTYWWHRWDSAFPRSRRP